MIKSKELKDEHSKLAHITNVGGRAAFWKATLALLKKQAKPLDYLEFGCAKGRTAKKFVKVLSSTRKYYTFDSFEGLPENWHSNAPIGEFKCDVPIFTDKRIKIVKGLYQDVLTDFLKEYEYKQVAFINMDSDLYSSTIYVLRQIRHLMKKDTYILLDDFLNNEVCLNHVFRAWQEFINETNLKFEYVFRHKRFSRMLVRVL